MRQTHILVVDDEVSVLRFLRAMLRDNGYEVLTASDGVEALQTLEKELPDLVILDIMMPRMDGFEVCRRIREWSPVPIIMLSVRGDEGDKVKCLDLGADDYITKPFAAKELIARVGAVLRRHQLGEEKPEPSFKSGELIVDFAGHKVTLAGQEIALTATEYGILSCMARNAGQLVTHDTILRRVWGEEYQGERHLLKVNINRLRQKLGDDARNPRYILTRHGIGYMASKEQPLS